MVRSPRGADGEFGPGQNPPPLLTPAHGIPIPAGPLRPPAPSRAPSFAPRSAPPPPPKVAPPPGTLGGPAAAPLPPRTGPASGVAAPTIGPPFLGPSTPGPFGGPGARTPYSFQERRTPSPSYGASPASYGASVLTPAHGVFMPGGSSPAFGVGPPTGVHGIAGAHVAPSAEPSSRPQAHRRTTWGQAIERFWRTFTRAVVGARMYAADSSVQADYLFQAHTSVDELLRQQSPLGLTLLGPTLFWGTEPVFQDDDAEGGLIASLAREGLEQLSFSLGVQRSEVQQLAEVFSQVTRASDGEVLTRLWSLDTPHIRYILNDRFDPISPTSRGLTAEDDQYRQLVLHVADAAMLEEPDAEALAAWAPPPPLAWAEALGDDLSQRRAELDEHDQAGPLMARSSLLLLGALGAEAEPTSETPAWRLLTELLRAVVCHGHFVDAQSLLDRMDDYGDRAASPNVRRMVEGVRGWLGSSDMIRPVLRIVEQTTENDQLQAAAGYLSRVGARADVSLWKLAGHIRSDVARHHIADILVQATERDPKGALSHLAEQSQPMVIDLVARAEQRRSAGADLLWWYGLEHRDPTVRAPATKLLRRRDGPIAEDVLLERLEDHDLTVRMAALDAIGSRPRQKLLDRVQSYFKLESLEQTSEVELGLAMVAFARILGPRAVPQLAHVLGEGHRLRLGTKAVEMQIKAAQVLGAIADPSAVKALQLGVQSRNPRIKSAAQKALEGYFAQGLRTDPLSQLDLSPRPTSMMPPRGLSAEPGRTGAPIRSDPSPRRLARGIMGLPSDGGSRID